MIAPSILVQDHGTLGRHGRPGPALVYQDLHVIGPHALYLGDGRGTAACWYTYRFSFLIGPSELLWSLLAGLDGRVETLDLWFALEQPRLAGRPVAAFEADDVTVAQGVDLVSTTVPTVRLVESAAAGS